MSIPRTTRATAYSEYVFSNLPASIHDRAGLYNYTELAALVGLKPTGNFRKRVKQLVRGGRLKAVPVFTPRGGIETRFQLPEVDPQMEMPF